MYERNYDYHTRNDNGVTTDANTVYGIGSTNINFTNSPYIPSTVPTANQANYEGFTRKCWDWYRKVEVSLYARSGAGN